MLTYVRTFAICLALSSMAAAADDSRGMKAVYAESRTALVIGNSTYAANPLVNPMNDATDVADLLRRRKFNVRLLTNCEKEAMDAAIVEFGQRLERGGVGLFYYAGHAVQVEGINFLLPVDAKIRKAHDLKYQGINVQRVLSEMDSSRNRLNMVILDACRDNPYPALARSLGNGLARVDAPRGSLIAYATAPGKTAADGDGRNGVFTGHFLKEAAVPGKEMLDMFRDVTAGVATTTKERQDPWIHQSVRGKFFFTPIDFLDQELELTEQELARYKQLLAEQEAADARIEKLEAEKNEAIGRMESEIKALRQKLQQPGGSGNTLDQLIALGKQREQYEKDIIAAKSRAEAERKERELEIARLRAQELANRKKKFEDEYSKYRWIAESKFMQPQEKLQAWNMICSNWGVTEITDAPGVLYWNDENGRVSCRPPGPEPGQELSVDLGGGVKMEFVWIEPGSFMMGSPANEDSRGSDELQHRVTLSKGFWMGKYEVTQEQWEKVMGKNPSHFKKAGKKAPVESVSWDDCQEFIRKLNAKGVGAGRSRSGVPAVPAGAFRLPTEAEWEYACRAGTTTAFHYGDSLDSSMANFDGDHPYGSGRKGEDRKTTVPVGSFKPNRWGLYDMHGNVWEWCRDWHGDYPKGAVTDPAGPSSGSYRVLRGGSWGNYSRSCRSASRGRAHPSFRFSCFGFRVVLFR